jgi:von Willebrand factor type A domain
MPAVAIIPWGFPGAFWFAIVALPVIAAFFFRFRSQIREIPALSHWLTIGRPMNIRSTGALLRRLLSLAMQILLIGLLVLCLANPFPRAPETHRLAIVIDVSATMQTREGGGNRLGLALGEARKILASQAHDAQIYLITAADKPVSLHAEAMNPADALKGLNEIRPSDTESDLPAAVRAVSFLAADPGAKAVVISDFAGMTAPSELASFWNGVAPLIFVPIGTDHPDVAVTASWAEPERHGWRIGASVTCRGFTGEMATARLISNGQMIAEKRVRLKDAKDRVEFRTDLPAGARYEIVVDAGDNLTVDDRVFGVLPSRPMICLVTEGNLPLERAIRADPTAVLRIVRHDQYDGPRDANVVIVDGPGLPTASPSKSCGYLFIDTADPFGFVTAGSPINAKNVSHWRGDHPTLAEIDPSNIHFHSALSLQPARMGNLVPLLSSDYIPLISERSGGDSSRIIYWAFRLSDTDLPSQLSFPILLWDTIDYLAGQNTDSEQHVTGHSLILQYPTEPQVTGPDAQPMKARPMSTGFVISDTRRQGFYKIRTKGREQTVAINLLSARGTLPLPRDIAVSAASVDTLRLTNQTRFNWRMLLIAGLMLAMIEWFLFHLRILRIG